MKKYTVSHSEDLFHVELDSTIDTPNITCLNMAPVNIEHCLQAGNWLILCFAVWNKSDYDHIENALTIAEANTSLQVGIRPFEFMNEFNNWLPETISCHLNQLGEHIYSSKNKHLHISFSTNSHPIWIAMKRRASAY